MSSSAAGTPLDATPPDARVLAKVRALLAKAESTSFAEEAEACTAKAQELMARHALDHALLAGVEPAGGASSRRVGLDDPYASAKGVLLGAVARANRCRVVLTDRSSATTFGYPADLDVVELLYTSLLLQAATAMQAAGTTPEQRSRRFRHAFLVSFAARIGARLARASEAVAREVDGGGGALVPVLASRGAEVDRAVAEAFPRVRVRRTTTSDARGWQAGTAAADRADVGGARLGGGACGALGRRGAR